MDKGFKFIVVLAFLSITIESISAQIKDTTYRGTVKGQLKDTTYNYALESATVSIYIANNNQLINYQLSNNFGRFQFVNMPVDVPLRLVASYVGYKATVKELTISSMSPVIDLRTVVMERQNLSLPEVTISALPPPMQMRGDTLEFNADAFKLDTNAVVEDLLRKLPGVTIWNDGLITVNGKKINKLLVEGKEFFGEGGKIALQDLSKDAVQKIQVYENKNLDDPIAPVTDMNIVLKKGKKNGYFGKLGGGYGTTDHYDGSGMLNYFSPKNEISFVAATNDVNKYASNITSLITLNSFKGETNDNDYYSDFTKQGLNTFNAFGLIINHDFKKSKYSKQDTNILKSDYLFRKNTGEVNRVTNAWIKFESNEQLHQTSNHANKNYHTTQRANFSYNKSLRRGNISGAYYFQNDKNNLFNLQDDIITNTLHLSNSRNRSEHNSSQIHSVTGGNLKVTKRSEEASSSFIAPNNIELNYLFQFNNSNETSRRVTSFTARDTSENKQVDRKYLLRSKGSSHTVISRFNNIVGLVFKSAPYFRTDIINSMSLYEYSRDNVVSDLRVNKLYTLNPNLTNLSNNRIFNDKPGLNFSKFILNRLEGRYRKAWNINFLAQGELYIEKNISEKDFQNLERSYFYFIPSANIAYSNFEFGGSRRSYHLNYNSSVIYPNIDQLAPLIDDANIFSVSYGNISLKPAYKRNWSFHYKYDNGESKNPLIGDLTLAVGNIKNFISDSSYFDALGRNIHYPMNVSNNNYASVGGHFQKGYKLKEHQVQLKGNSNVTYKKYLSSLNGDFYLTKSKHFNLSTDLVYIYKDILTANIGESFFATEASQSNLSKFTFYNWSTYSNILFALPKGIFINTRLDININKSSYGGNINYTIWNIDLGCRFLKGENAEIKLSALDLLHQNESAINYINSSSITTGSVNVLQQYFMLKLAYYPRKFGFEKSKPSH